MSAQAFVSTDTAPLRVSGRGPLALLFTDLISGGLSIEGLVAWVLATLIVWL